MVEVGTTFSLYISPYVRLPVCMSVSNFVSVTRGGGGCFLACENLGCMFDHSFPACAFFFLQEVS